MEPLAESGGGPRHVYPKHVWSWSGGWWANPARWKGNTFFAAAAMCVASVYLDHHWILDGIVGAAVAWVSVVLARRLLNYQRP